MKRDVQAGGVVQDTHGAVVEAIAQDITLWTTPFSPEMERRHICPGAPDMWMLSAKGVASGDFSESWSFFPSIPTLLKRWQVRSAVYIREATTRHQRGPPIRWACIASNKPIPVPPGQLEQMRNMLQTLNPRQERKALGLLQKLHEAHILEPAEQETVMCCT